jgi:hypothetical protein
VYHPGSSSGIIRLPYGPPPNLASNDPKNFVRFQSRAPIIFRNNKTSNVAVPVPVNGSTNITEFGNSGGDTISRVDYTTNLSKYSAELTSWRTQSIKNVIAYQTQQAEQASGMKINASIRKLSLTSTTRTRSRSPFRKSLMWQSKQGLISSRRPGTNYQGDIWSKSGLATEQGLDDHLNCTLWLEDLPKDVTYQAMFDWLEEMKIGRIWALDIKPPQGNFETSAARLTFFKQSSAQRIYDAAQERSSLYMNGHRVKVLFNRSGNRARDGYETRIIQIQGPAEMMSWKFWDSFFRDGIVYDLDRWLFLPCKMEGRAEMEIRFARVDGQAQTCIQKIYKDVSMDDIVSARYGRDPCEE